MQASQNTLTIAAPDQCLLLNSPPVSVKWVNYQLHSLSYYRRNVTSLQSHVRKQKWKDQLYMGDANRRRTHNRTYSVFKIRHTIAEMCGL
jgi:hypothetical protein